MNIFRSSPYMLMKRQRDQAQHQHLIMKARAEEASALASMFEARAERLDAELKRVDSEHEASASRPARQ